MKVVKRIIAVVGAPVLLAGFMLAGSASARPATATGPALPETATFTAQVITGTDTFTVVSTSCTLTGNGGHAYACFLSGSGTLGDPITGNIAITGAKFSPITLALTQETSNCGAGSGIQIESSGPKNVEARISVNTNHIIQTGPNMYTVAGTIKIGVTVGGCDA